MELPDHLALRDARDRLVDLLELGESYPLRDLPICRVILTVPVGDRARIPVEGSQRGVAYSLHELDGDGAVLAEAEGTGDTLLLETPPILEDVTFAVHARKPRTGREARLFQTAAVKVGLDQDLAAHVRTGEPLVSEGTELERSARLVPFGTRVEVALEDSQEGVDYRLVTNEGEELADDVAFSTEVRGDTGTIVLESEPLQEDTNLRLRAVKTFDPGEGRPPEASLLRVELPVRVRADPAVSVRPEAEGVLPWRATSAVRIAEPQETAFYRAHTHRVRHEEFVREELDREGVLEVAVPGEPSIGVEIPALGGTWEVLPGFEPLGEPLPGAIGSFRIELGPLEQDTLVVLEAIKRHRVGETLVVESAVSLLTPVVRLVEPDPARELVLRELPGGENGARVRLSGGAPGVYYVLRGAAEGPDLGLPAYFHERLENDPAESRGVGSLALEVDLAVARDDDGGLGEDGATDAALATPTVETKALGESRSVHVHARKAQTRVAKGLDEVAVFHKLPTIRAAEELVDHGAKTALEVAKSRPVERYSLLGDASDPQAGTGGKLTFPVGPLVADTVFSLLVTRPVEQGHTTERVVDVTVAVRPNPDLEVVATEDEVTAGEGTTVRVLGTQGGVTYRLFRGNSGVGDAEEGALGIVELSTGPLTEQTKFSVRAKRLHAPAATVKLGTEVVVDVRPSEDD